MSIDLQPTSAEETETAGSGNTYAAAIAKIMEPIRESGFEELVELGSNDVVGEWWSRVSEAVAGGYISRELALQQFFELSHIASIAHLQKEPKKLTRIREMIGQELPLPGWHARELLDELIEPAHVDGMRELHADASEKYYAPYVGWRHSMNEGPLAVGLRTVFSIVDTFPGIYSQDERKCEIVEKLRIIEAGLSPTQFSNGDIVDWSMWEPDFSTWDEESNSWGLQEIQNPKKKARLQQENWKYKIS